MRNWSFAFDKKEDCDKAFDQFFEMFKECKEYGEKKVIFCRTNENTDTWKIYLSIEDVVPGSFIVSVSNAFDKNLKNAFTVIKADCKDIHVEFPTDCKIMSWYEKDLIGKKDESGN